MELAFIGMGANIAGPAGPPESTLAAAVEGLDRVGRVVCRSSLYSTRPVGFVDQPRFVNAVAGVETQWSAPDLLRELLRIERAFGRDRSTGFRNGPRPLDLDLLLLGGQVLDAPGLSVPHPRLHEREFVLVPLHEIAPELIVGTTGKTVKQLLQGLRSGFPTESDAVFPLQSDLWRACPCGDDVLRANSADTHGHG